MDPKPETNELQTFTAATKMTPTPVDPVVTVTITLRKSQCDRLTSELAFRTPRDIGGFNLALYRAFNGGVI